MHVAPVFHPGRSKYFVFTVDFLVPTIICLGVLLLGYIVLYSPFFKVNKVICVLDYQDCTDGAVISELDKLIGQNIFKLSTSRVADRLTSGDFTIREVELKRELPSTVSIDLQSVYPVVALQIEGDPTWVVMDSKFRVIGTRSTEPNVPTVLVPGPITLTVGKPPSDDVIIHTLGLAIRLADELFTVKTITLVDEGTIKLSLSDGRTALFTPKNDELVQLRALQAILSDATISKGVKTIDVRFSQPVLR